jgi:hypothetical protein
VTDIKVTKGAGAPYANPNEEFKTGQAFDPKIHTKEKLIEVYKANQDAYMNLLFGWYIEVTLKPAGYK